MTKWILGALAAIALFAPSAASADEAPAGFPTTDPIHRPMVESLEPVAEAYWAQRGVTLPTPVEVFVIAKTPAGGAFGDQPGSRVWLTQSVVELRGLAGRSFLCMIYLHERGHNAGLAHGSGDPIMAADPWEGMTEVVPKCFKWAESGYLRALGH
jgi:hypothetical protein